MKKKVLIGLTALAMTFGLASCGQDGQTPYVGSNGDWWIGDSDIGVTAQGPAGQDGKSVTVVSVVKTSSEGLVDTYTITFSDGTKTTFTVTNGEANSIVSIELTSSSGLTDTYTITFSNGSTKTFTVTNGKAGANGKDLTITSIELISSEGLIDTYVINYSDGSKFEFVVSNGADGQTPYIGDNGNWWIGDTDTGVIADYEMAQNVPLTIYSNGLKYETRTLCGKSGYVVTGWSDDYLDDNYLFDLIANGMDPEEAEEFVQDLQDNTGKAHLVIPNYVGSVPVIGVGANSELDFGKITLSRNTVWLGDNVFYNCTNLSEVDFNNSNVTQIPYQGFMNTKISNIQLPSSVNVIRDYGFSGVEMDNFDLTNIRYFGTKSLDSLYSPYVYLSKDIQYVGDRAFYATRVYLEHETYPTSWPTEITSSQEWNSKISVNCKQNDEYLYSINEAEVTVYQYLGSEKKITIPSTIEEKPVTKIGYGFNTPTKRNYNLDNLEELNEYIYAEEVNIPEGVKEIEDYSLCGICTTIFAPKSLEKISELLLCPLIDFDDFYDVKVNGVTIYAFTNYLALAGSEMPTVIDEDGHTVLSKWTREKIESGIYRISFDINRSKVYDDEKYYYIDEGLSYSILSYKTLKGESLIVPSTFSNKQVSTILRGAIGVDTTLKQIKIENGITKIRPYAIIAHNVKMIYIPLSVQIINAYGVCSKYDTIRIYVAAPSKPVDWDSNWTDVLSCVVFGIDGEVETNNFFVYSIKNNDVNLISYIGTSSNVTIPSDIDGKTVRTVKTGFYRRKGGAEIFIPSSVTTIESNAFVNTYTKQFDIHIAAQEKPSGWNDNWYYNTYSSNNTAYVNKIWGDAGSFNYRFNDEYAYIVDDSGVTLLSFCGNKDIVRIPRQIENKNVTTIKAYCFYYETKATIYIPNEVTTIEQIGIEYYTNYSSEYLTVNCEPNNRPSGWNYYFAYNSYQQSTSYISINYGQNIGY